MNTRSAYVGLKVIAAFIFYISLVTLNSSAYAAYKNDLAQYCQNDPTGELYSELTDAFNIEVQFEIIGLNPHDYTSLIWEYKDSSFWDLAELTAQTHPEISDKLRIWELETCINRGFEMLYGSK